MDASYHHGNLRDAILDRALAIIADDGVDALSLRAVASELGVSHAAPRHHFASKEALLTAIATDGFAALADALEAVGAAGGSFLDAGVAYVRFALDHPAAFAVMFTPTLLDNADPAYAHAAGRALSALRSGAAGAQSDPQAKDEPEAEDESEGERDDEAAGVAAWSLVHGFAALALSGSLSRAGFAPPGTNLTELAARAAGLLGPST